MLKEITKEEYSEIYQSQKLVVFETFTDVDGTLPFGYGVPAMDTSWGVKGEEHALIKNEARKQNRHQKDWDYKFYKYDNE